MSPIWKQKLDVIEQLRKQHGEPVVLDEFAYPGQSLVRRVGYDWVWADERGRVNERDRNCPQRRVVIGGQVTSLDSSCIWIRAHLMVGLTYRLTDLHRDPSIDVVPPRQNYSVCIKSHISSSDTDSTRRLLRAYSRAKGEIVDLAPGLVLLYGWLLPEDREHPYAPELD